MKKVSIKVFGEVFTFEATEDEAARFNRAAETHGKMLTRINEIEEELPNLKEQLRLGRVQYTIIGDLDAYAA
jgi:hypothetical protein